MSDLNEIGERDGWRCWLCDKAVDPDASVNSDLGPSADSFALAKAKKGASGGERLAHRMCNTMKGKHAPVVAWPEELIAAAHAACFSMAFSHQLAQAGFTPTAVQTTANVTLTKTDSGFAITQIALICDADVAGISEATFFELANAAKIGCPVSKALASVPEITLQATLKKAAA